MNFAAEINRANEELNFHIGQQNSGVVSITSTPFAVELEGEALFFRAITDEKQVMVDGKMQHNPVFYTREDAHAITKSVKSATGKPLVMRSRREVTQIRIDHLRNYIKAMFHIMSLREAQA